MGKQKKIVKNENEKYEESLMLRTTRVERFLTTCESENRFDFLRLHLHSHRDLMLFCPCFRVCVSVYLSLSHCSRFCFLGELQARKSCT